MKIKKCLKGLIVILIIGISTILVKTYTFTKNKDIPAYGANIKLAIVVDGKKAKEIPESALGKDDKYYEVGVKCESSVVKDLWDYNAWKLNLNNIESNTQCDLTFTSQLSKEDYKRYIEAGIYTRRNTYRGKDITEYKSLASDNKMNLYNQIKNCTFDDIYVGDYIESSQTNVNDTPIRWLVADINNFRYTGDTSLDDCHVTIIPSGFLEENYMNSTDTTEGGYLNSEMKTTILPAILDKYIKPDFDGHILTFRNMLSSTVDASWLNKANSQGVSSGNTWTDSQIDLMSEINVFGTNIFSSSGYDTGMGNRQFAIFQLRPEFITTYKDDRYFAWLRSVATTDKFVAVNAASNCDTEKASKSKGVRPMFLIG